MFAALAVLLVVAIADAPSGRKRVGVRGGVVAFDASSSPGGAGGDATPPFTPPTTPTRRGDAAGKISFAVVATVSSPPPPPPVPGARDAPVATAVSLGDATAAPAGASDVIFTAGLPCTLWLFSPSVATVVSPT